MDDQPLHESGGKTGTPRWVKIQGVFVALLLLAVVGMSSGLINPGLLGLEGGGHGPAMHAPSQMGH